MKNNKQNNKNIIRIDDDKEIKNKIEETKKQIKDNKDKEIINKKSKLSIFFLIISLIVIILYGINIYLNLDFSNLILIDLIKPISFILISLIVIFILFKVNNKSTTPFIILLTILLIVYLFFSISYSNISDIYVSDFINKNITEVIEWANLNNIEIIELHEYSDTVLKNHVIMQEYGINTLIKDITSIKITISDGPNYDKEVIVSNLTGFKYDEVMQYIEDNYLCRVEIEFIEDDIEKDTVIEQIGSGSLKRNSLIKFIFSKGHDIEETTVKDLKGLSLFQATSYLKRYSINYEIEYVFSDNISKNYVISQDIVNEIVQDKLKLTVSKGHEIKVPDLTKMTTNEISIWAFNNNIKIEYDEVYDKEIEFGKIIKQSISSGNIVEEDSTITITISKGSMIMPKVDNLSDFKLWASKNNVNYEEVYEYSDKYENGEIISTTPSENTKLTEDDTIIIVISKGKSISIPNFVGLSKSNIENKCKNLNLSCTFKYSGYTESTKKDIALKQSKASGSIVASGTNILITLSSGIYEKVNVPSFIGKTKSEITSNCNKLGITCTFKYNSTYSTTPKDSAISQDKTGSVNKGSTVNITLSIGKAKTYTVVIDGSLLSLGNPEQTKNTLKSKLESACPGVNFKFSFKAVNSGIGYLNPDSDVKVGNNTFTQGKTYNVIINSSN